MNPTGDKVSLSYYFDGSYSDWLPEEKAAIRKALAEFSQVARISFDETYLRHEANLIEYTATTADLGGALGLHEPPEYATINWWNTWQEEGWFRNDEGERGVIIEIARGGSGSDRLRGNRADNKLDGNAGDDRIIGSGGDDRLKGGKGSDTLIGGNGDDRMVGNGGDDAFHFRKGWDCDVIKKFRDDTDTLVLSDNLWKGSYSTKKVVKKFAEVEQGDTVFDFGRDELVLDGFKDLGALRDDIEIA